VVGGRTHSTPIRSMRAYSWSTSWVRKSRIDSPEQGARSGVATQVVPISVNRHLEKATLKPPVGTST
jgi:hypothetical protein